ncbi:MAG: copper resistance protein NlpE N-terminal domain-containing protein [Bergeyella zoohelcum]|nr:copper resistance protein NlpE N-terminal domain-containing protein [Bergeyella zoohelcum]
MKKLILPILATGLMLTACKKTEEVKTEGTTETTEVATTDSLQTAQTEAATPTAFGGTYKGTTPCADCPGIDVTLTLNTDNTFTLEEVYQGDKGTTLKTEGTLEVKGSYATLKEKDAKDGIKPRVIFVEGNNVWFVDAVDATEKQDTYKLVKQ